MRLHIATLGLHANERIEHMVMKRGADKVVLFYTERNKDEVKEFVSRFSRAGIPTETVIIPPWDFQMILAKILETIVENEEYDEIEFNASCGTRVMTAASYVAAVHSDAMLLVISEDETTVLKEIIEIQPFSKITLTRPKRRILEQLVELGGTVYSQKELGTRAELEASSISRHVRDLEQVGNITRKRMGRQKLISITPLGRIVLRTRQIRERHRGKTDE